MLKVKAVAVVIKNPEDPNLILSVSRKDNKNDFGLPGGKIEDNETPIQAAVREIKEEVNLNIKDLSFILTDYDKAEKYNYYCSAYLAPYPDNEKVISQFFINSEFCVVKWSTWEELFKGTFGLYNEQVCNALKEKI